MINRFVLNEVSYFGPGAREVLPQEIKRLGLKKAFVSTDKDLIKFGVADKVLSVLDKAGIPYVVFSDIKPNPTVSNVNAGVKAFAESGADFILAIGGGSSIDTSKAIGIITNNPEFSDVVSLEGVAPDSALYSGVRRWRAIRSFITKSSISSCAPASSSLSAARSRSK